MSNAATAGYELWDTESGNLLDDFDSEAQALETVRELIVLNGSDSTDALALTRVDVNGRTTTLAMGEALAARAGSAESQQGRASA